MSESENSEIEQVKPEANIKKEVKKKRQLSPEALEKLAKAREKANAVRMEKFRERQAVKNKAKEAKELKQSKKKVVEPESESSEEEIRKVVRKKKTKKKQRIIFEDSSSSDSDAEIVIKRRSGKKKNVLPEIPVQRSEPIDIPQKPERDTYREHMQNERLKAIRSLFPMYNGH